MTQKGKTKKAPQKTAMNARKADILDNDPLDGFQKEGDLYRIFAEASPDMIYLLDRDGRVLFGNLNAARQWNYQEAEEIIDKRQEELFPPHIAERHKQVIQKIFDTGQPVFFNDHEKIGEQHCWVDARMIPVLNKDGRVTAVLGISRDITEHKRVKETLRIKDVAIASSLNGMAITDLGRKLIYVNDSFLKLLGYDSEQEVIGKSYSAFFEDPAQARVVADAIQQNGQWSGELNGKKKDGAIITAQFSGNILMDSAGNIIGMMATFIDITERRQAEKALHESEERYREMFEQIAVGVLMINMETKQFGYVNPAICQMFGYSKEEFMRLSIADIHPKGALDHVAADFEAQVQKLLPAFPCRRKDGTVFYADITGTSAILQGKKLNIGFFVDITERKQTEGLLQQERAMLNSIIDLNPYGIQIYDAEGHHVRANKAFLNMFQAVPPADYCFFDDPIAAKAGFREANLAVKEGKTHMAPEIWYNPHWLHPELPDKLSCFRSTVFPIMNAEGKMKYFVVMFEDITEHKRAEEALKESNANFQNFVMAASDPIQLLDVDGTIRICNETMARAFGSTAAEMIGRNVFVGIPPEIAAERSALLDQVVKTKQAIHYEEQVGDFVYDTVLTPIMNSKGEVVNIAVFPHDITAYKKVEEELKSIDQMKTNFITTVSHELRTPLSITNEGLSLVLDRIAGQINEKQEVILSAAKNNVERLARIIYAVCDISNIESGKVKLKMELVNIVDKANEVVASFAQQAKNKGLELKTGFSSPAINIYLDPDKTIRIFTNLISNAIKFTQEGHVDIRIKEMENEVECLVADTGIGIPENDLPKVFSKFQQFDRVYGPGEKGTGLGLAIVKDLVEMHGGKIRVESKRDSGTKFMFTFPRSKDPGQA